MTRIKDSIHSSHIRVIRVYGLKILMVSFVSFVPFIRVFDLKIRGLDLSSSSFYLNILS
jgi:hypothetical protein